jgi:hypothetical protein
MNDPGNSADNNEQGQDGVPPARQNLPSTQAATEQQLYRAEQKIDERMSAFERSTIRLTKNRHLYWGYHACHFCGAALRDDYGGNSH